MKTENLAKMFVKTEYGHLVILAALVLQLASSAMSLRCYYCTIQPPSANSNRSARFCSNFDGSSMYEVDCPYSTFCMKKTFDLQLQKGKTARGVIRDCAPQRYNYQTYDGTKWQSQDAVADKAYVAGCHPSDSHGVKTPTTEYCYCSGNLCNGAKPSSEASHHHTDAMAVIFVFNAMKYIRSLR